MLHTFYTKKNINKETIRMHCSQLFIRGTIQMISNIAREMFAPLFAFESWRIPIKFVARYVCLLAKCGIIKRIIRRRFGKRRSVLPTAPDKRFVFFLYFSKMANNSTFAGRFLIIFSLNRSKCIRAVSFLFYLVLSVSVWGSILHS